MESREELDTVIHISYNDKFCISVCVCACECEREIQM